jgi:dihydropteroate synthase
MGILNVTPDSFSDGGRFYTGHTLVKSHFLEQAEIMAEGGVDIFDVGGESTRPGALPVSTKEELARVLPAVSWLKDRFSLPVSVDTSNPEVMRAVADAGADMINDVRALTRNNALQAAAATGLPVCMMHMPAEPADMQINPHYDDVVVEVSRYLSVRVAAALDAGIDASNIVIDPGFGFGKTLTHNLALFRALPELTAGDYPVLVGVSRKRMVGDILNRDDPKARVFGSVALAQLAVQAGVRIVRVHDVAPTVDALRILEFVKG